MTSDRELLELAAKAAGIRYIKPTADYSGALGLALCDEHGRIGQDWSPLVDDGDALRLVVKLAIDVQLFGTIGWRPADERPWMRTLVDRLGKGFREDAGDDPLAATRRAIVRAAAEIGKTMP